MKILSMKKEKKPETERKDLKKITKKNEKSIDKVE